MFQGSPPIVVYPKASSGSNSGGESDPFASDGGNSSFTNFGNNGGNNTYNSSSNNETECGNKEEQTNGASKA